MFEFFGNNLSGMLEQSIDWGSIGSSFAPDWAFTGLDSLASGIGDSLSSIPDFSSDILDNSGNFSFGLSDSPITMDTPLGTDWLNNSIGSYLPETTAGNGWLESLLSEKNLPSLIKAGSGLLQYLTNKGQAGDTQKTAQQASQQADPFGSQRALYADYLRKMMADPGGYMKSNVPGFTAGLNLGLEGIARNNAKKGMLDSGNINYDIMDYSQKYLMDQFNNQQQNLGNLAGAQFNPATAAEFLYKGQQDANQLNRYGLAALVDPWKKEDAVNTANQDIGNYTNDMSGFLTNLTRMA